MKKLILFLILFLSFPLSAWAKLKVVTTIPTLGALTEAIGGDRVTIKSLAKPGQDPHFLLPKPNFAVALNRADLFVNVGMDLEIGWLPAVLVQARNPKVQPGRPGYVDASLGIQALEVPTGVINRARGDIHPLGNPHYYLDPRNGLVIARNIFTHLVEIDPEGETYYQSRMHIFTTTLNQKIQSWQKQATSLRASKWITYHLTWTYLANWLGLEVVAQVEPLPGIPPSAKHIRYLNEITPQNQVKGLIMAPYYPKKVPTSLATKNQFPLIVLPANTEGITGSDYFEMFENIILKLNVMN